MVGAVSRSVRPPSISYRTGLSACTVGKGPGHGSWPIVTITSAFVTGAEISTIANSENFPRPRPESGTPGKRSRTSPPPGDTL